MNTIQENEIDLYQLFKIFWKGRLKILAFMLVSVFLVFIYNQIYKDSSFIASTEIKPIVSHEFDKYKQFNETNFYKIDRYTLLDLYVEYIKEGTILEKAIEKFDLINKENFNNEKDYRQAAEKFASQMIEFIPKKNQKVNPIDRPEKYYILKAQYDDAIKWKKLLLFINNEASNRVKEIIKSRFNVLVSVASQKRDFLIEDLNTKITNLKHDYKRLTKDKLAFLAEQASIARKLKLRKNTEVSDFRNNSYQQKKRDSNILTDFLPGPLHYLKGYETIEQEIAIINARKNQIFFIKDLLPLEQEKRYIEQDKALPRAQSLFNNTPIMQNDFKAVSLKVQSTKFKKINKTYLYYPISIVIGCFLGIIYVLISTNLTTRKIK